MKNKLFGWYKKDDRSVYCKTIDIVKAAVLALILGPIVFLLFLGWASWKELVIDFHITNIGYRSPIAVEAKK